MNNGAMTGADKETKAVMHRLALLETLLGTLRSQRTGKRAGILRVLVGRLAIAFRAIIWPV